MDVSSRSSSGQQDGSNLSGRCSQLTNLGDNAYHDPTVQAWLKEARHIQLLAAQRKDAKEPWPEQVRALIGRARRLIETVLSVLCTVFYLEQIGARSCDGRLARLASRFLAYNLSFIVTRELAVL